jgi:chromosome partitioning protein
MAKVVALANQKGGVGKTTTAINLSSALSLRGLKTLLIDLDSQANATSGLGLSRDAAQKSIYDALLGDDDVESLIVKVDSTGLNLLPSSRDLAGAEVELTGVIGREMRLKRKMGPLLDEYAYIFIDCPPSLGLLTVNALTAADSVLLPIQCEYYALEGLTQLLDTIKLVRENLNWNLFIEGILMTMWDYRTNLSRQVVDEVASYFPNELYRAVIPRNVKLSEAPGFGKDIFAYDPHCSGAHAYMDACKEFLTRNGEQIDEKQDEETEIAQNNNDISMF